MYVQCPYKYNVFPSFNSLARKRTMRFLSSRSFLLTAYFSLPECSVSNPSPDSMALHHEDDSSELKNQVTDAIKICREKLDVDPNFPKVQHSLANLLDSEIDRLSPTKAEVDEVIHLYFAVGNPSSNVQSSRIPPVSIRFQSLCRAASISDEVLHDSSNAIRYYTSAMELKGVDCESLVPVYELVMPLILSSVIEKRERNVAVSPFSAMQHLQHRYLQSAMNLSDLLSEKCPHDPIADEYKGATLRKLKEPSLAYESYLTAALKSRQLYQDYTITADEISVYEHLTLLRNYIRRAILVSAAGRENGMGPGEQMSILTEAESHVAPLLQKITADGVEVDASILNLGKDVVVELYNNMGIINKKIGVQSETFFLKALEINPNDGHTLVQLASVANDGKSRSSEIVADVKELDSEYVGALFDAYSLRFESELLDVLDYKGHNLVHEAIMREWKLSGRNVEGINSIIDLGVGTGLLGELFANEIPNAIIHGVDLSERMANISRERKTESGRDVYSIVVKADAQDFLESYADDAVDCIVASDVFIYVGDIEGVFKQSARCLSKDGLVGFTVESFEDNSTSNLDGGLKLLPSGRFGHSRAYIDRVAKASGFELLTWNKCTLRKQGLEGVDGAVVVLKLLK